MIGQHTNRSQILSKSLKPDIVHTHAAKAGALGRLAAHNLGVPVILHTFHGHVFHSYFGKLKTRLFIEIERFLARRSTRIIAISNIQRKELADTYKIAPFEKFSVVPLGFDLDRFQEDIESKRADFRDRYKVKEDEVAIGIIGRLVPIKNHPMFLRAIAELRKEVTNARIFIIGDGEERSLVEEYCGELGLEFGDATDPKWLTFTSWIKEVDWAIAGLDIVALSSFNEGTPVSLIEAQAGGKPVVSTNVGGIEDIMKIDGSGYLVESDDHVGICVSVE